MWNEAVASTARAPCRFKLVRPDGRWISLTVKCLGYAPLALVISVCIDFDDAKLSFNATQSLSHKAWSEGAAMDASSTADQSVKLVGVLTGDVDGSWAG